MWGAIAYVSSGLSLAAFIAAVVAWTIKLKSEERARLIKTVGEAERAALVRNTLEFFHVQTESLTQEKQFILALEQVRERANRFKITAFVVCFLALVTAFFAAYAISQPQPITPSPPSRQITSNSTLLGEGRFRIKQVDEVFSKAEDKDKECMSQIKTEGAVLGECIRDFLHAAKLISVTMELGGIYRPPGSAEDTVWIGNSGYGLRHLPNRRSFKYDDFSSSDFRDLFSENINNIGQRNSALKFLQEADIQLNDLKMKAQFSHLEILKDWRQRNQGQGIYGERYGGAYKVFDVMVDDYGNELKAVSDWIRIARESWEQFKKLKVIVPFL